jgi:hypothetical protein
LVSSRKHREALESWQKVIRGKKDWFAKIRVHEAGHAVAGYLLGHHLQRISISRRYYGKKRRQGITIWSLRGIGKLEWPGPRTKIWYVPRNMHELFFTHTAPEVAEIWFFDHSRYKGGDWNGLVDVISSYVGNREVAGRCFLELRKQAVNWFMEPSYMEAVAAVANALRKKPVMSGREVRRIIRGTGLKPLKSWKAKRVVVGVLPTAREIEKAIKRGRG